MPTKMLGLQGGADDQWIQKAIRRPGALHKALGIPKDQTIPMGTLRKAAQLPGVTGRRARLAITLRSFKKGGGPTQSRVAPEEEQPSGRRQRRPMDRPLPQLMDDDLIDIARTMTRQRQREEAIARQRAEEQRQQRIMEALSQRRAAEVDAGRRRRRGASAAAQGDLPEPIAPSQPFRRQRTAYDEALRAAVDRGDTLLEQAARERMDPRGPIQRAFEDLKEWKKYNDERQNARRQSIAEMLSRQAEVARTAPPQRGVGIGAMIPTILDSDVTPAIPFIPPYYQTNQQQEAWDDMLIERGIQQQGRPLPRGRGLRRRRR